MPNNFKPAWWLPGPHLQTLWPALLRRRKLLPIRYERLELADGDFVDLGWVGHGDAPLVLILHGLNGSIRSHYVNGLLHAILQRGWRGVVMHFRGCSGEPNRMARSYHSGETGDLRAVINELLRRDPKLELLVVGYSLGGNVLLKALGTDVLPLAVKAAVAVSVPFDLAMTAKHMSKGMARLYQRHLVKGLVRQYKQKFGKTISPLVRDLRDVTTFWEFDDNVTAPLHGFINAEDYYQQSSSYQFLKNIKIPTLIIHAEDDPFTAPSSLPQAHVVSERVVLQLTKHGGHVGYIAGNYPWRPIYWLEQRILNFFADIDVQTLNL